MSTPSRRARKWWLALRLSVPVAVFAYLATVVPLADVFARIVSITPAALAAALLFYYLGIGAATLRWSLLFRACGVGAPPGLSELLRLQLIGAFYNNYAPGGLGGDLVRGVASRSAMPGASLAGALAIVLLDRVCGLAGLILLLSVSFAVFPLAGIPYVLLWSVIGLTVAAAVVVSIGAAPRVAPHLPGRLSKVAASLPAVRSLPLLCGVLALSVVTNMTLVLMGHSLLISIASVPFSESLVILPLASLAAYFPLTVGGVGVREGAFVVLYALVGVAKSDAFAASLVFYGVTLIGAGTGGILHLLRPANLRAAAEEVPFKGR